MLRRRRSASTGRGVARWEWARIRTVRSKLAVLYGAVVLAAGAVVLLITALLWGSTTVGSISGSPSPSRIFEIAGLNAHQRPVASAATTGTPLHVNTWSYVSAKRREVVGQLNNLVSGQHRSDFLHLLIISGIALALMAFLAAFLGWWTSGRALRPVRAVTSAARDISATNLHERLSLRGPDDELKELGDTFDGLLARLDAAFQAQQAFVTNASHELRTPLATMRTALDVAQAKPGPMPDATRVLATRLRHELDQVDGLLEGFLVLARTQAGPMDGDEELNLADLVAESVRRHEALTAARRIDMKMDATDAFVDGNHVLLSRLVDNLVDNAIGHNVEGGWVRIWTEVEDGTARCTVENGGPLLDAEDVRSLTEPFRRLGTDRTASGRGFGLGLSIVEAIAQSHDGHVRLDAPPSGGFRAVVELPLLAPERELTPA